MSSSPGCRIGTSRGRAARAPRAPRPAVRDRRRVAARDACARAASSPRRSSPRRWRHAASRCAASRFTTDVGAGSSRAIAPSAAAKVAHVPFGELTGSDPIRHTPQPSETPRRSAVRQIPGRNRTVAAKVQQAKSQQAVKQPASAREEAAEEGAAPRCRRRGWRAAARLGRGCAWRLQAHARALAQRGGAGGGVRGAVRGRAGAQPHERAAADHHLHGGRAARGARHARSPRPSSTSCGCSTRCPSA